MKLDDIKKIEHYKCIDCNIVFDNIYEFDEHLVDKHDIEISYSGGYDQK